MATLELPRRRLKVCRDARSRIVAWVQHADRPSSLRPADAARLSREIRSHLPGAEKEVKKDAEAASTDVNKTLNDATAEAKAGVSKVDQKLEAYRKDAEKSIDQTAKDASTQANQAIDKFDKSVTEVGRVGSVWNGRDDADIVLQGAGKAKSSISSWFGGSK